MAASFGTCFAIAGANMVSSESLLSTKTIGSPSVIFPGEHNGLCISAAGKIGDSYRFVHTLYENLLLADAKVRPSIESELAELINTTLFHSAVVVRCWAWTEPQICEPTEHKKSSRHQDYSQRREDSIASVASALLPSSALRPLSPLVLLASAPSGEREGAGQQACRRPRCRA